MSKYEFFFAKKKKKTISSDFTIVVVKCKYIKKLIKNIF